MKKILCIFLIIFLVGCTKEEKVPEEVLNFEMAGTSKKVGEKYNIVLKDIDLEFDVVNGYSDTLEFYMKEEINNDNRLDGYLKIINYLKSISIDNKILNSNSEEEFDTEKIDTLSKGIFFDINIDEISYRVSIYQYNNIDYLGKKYSTYTLSFTKK